MAEFPKKVAIFEEGPREGFQIEKGPIGTEDKIRLIDALSETGVGHIQTMSFVNPKRVPGMADAEAVVKGIKVKPGVEYSALWMNERGLRQALSFPHLTVDGKIRIYASEAFLRSNLERTVEEHLQKNREIVKLCKSLGVPVTQASVASAFGCNFQGDVTPKDVARFAGQAVGMAREEDIELKELILADSMAWATPDSIKRTVEEVRKDLPDLAIRLHLHDTRGMGIANAYAGLEMGVDRYDSSVAGLGGCPFAKHKGAAGNVCTEDLVFMLEEMGIETGIDLDAMIEASALAEEIVGHPLPGRITKGGSLRAIRRGLPAAA